MPVNHNHKALFKVTDDCVGKFLHAVGVSGVSVAAMIAPVVTGLYRNSITYKTNVKNAGRSGGFGSASGKGGKVSKPAEDISIPEKQNTVRIGSAIVYAGAVERKHGVLAASYHTMTAKLDEIARRMFK